jgi:hypothetical protein
MRFFGLIAFFLIMSFYPIDDGFSQKKEIPVASKIHPLISQWQSSTDPEAFARENNLSHDENTLKVYIYLKNTEARFELSSEITIIAFDDKIAVAFVSQEQLDKIVNSDFIERITLPNTTRTPPIPELERSEPQTIESDNNYPEWIIIGGIVLFSLIVIIQKYRNNKIRSR